jgi:hypothetical protein
MPRSEFRAWGLVKKEVNTSPHFVVLSSRRELIDEAGCWLYGSPRN